MPTAPTISAGYTDVWLSGLWGALVSSKPIYVNASLNNSTISVHQKVVIGVKGKEVTQWDPGLPPSKESRGEDEVVLRLSESEGIVSTKFSQFSNGIQIQPGKLSVEKSTVFLHTAVLPDYGHGGEVVEVSNVSASASFPQIKLPKSGRPFELEGEFEAQVNGSPVGGGYIDVSAHADAKRVMNLQPGDEICSVHVRGEEILAPKIAAFLSLPFRADGGECGGDVRIEFLYRTGTLVPDIHGEAEVQDLSLRFHPDPKTPEFVDVSGKLRFDRKDLFLDGARGTLGTLPMTVVGNIDLIGDYNIMGYIPSVDVNNILETFDVERFVPVVGQVKGEARMTGPLEEPTIFGWAETTSEEVIFDRLPLVSASVDFEWEAIAGTLKFTDIQAKIVGQGSCSGEGGLYFDMTKATPYGVNRLTHHSNSPKAAYWNAGATETLPPLPEDDLEIDDHAPYRPYDSMRFDFKVHDVNGSDLLRFYGGKYGGMAALSVGTVEGSGILAGHSKDANCRVIWRSVSPPPAVALRNLEEPIPDDAPISGNNEKLPDVPDDERDGLALSKPEEPNGSTPGHHVLNSDQAPSAANEQTTNPALEPANESTFGTTFNLSDSRDSLGGGEFQGLVYIKLGDLPAARRVKVRTIVKGLDARRLGWMDETFQGSLSQVPLLDTSVDSYFKGVMYQRPIIPPGCTEVPRTPRMELLGADGALAVRKLSMNNVNFSKTMAGSFSFSTSDFSMSLKEISRNRQPPSTSPELNPQKESTSGGISPTEKPESPSSTTTGFGDELTVAASLKGEAQLRLRQRKTEIVVSVSTDRSRHQIVDIFARRVAIQDFLGADFKVGGASTVGGIVNTDVRLDLSTRSGEGNFSLRRPRIGPLGLVSVSSDVLWRGQDISLLNCLLRSRKSEIALTGNATMPPRSGGAFSWEANIDVPRASLQEIIGACRSVFNVAVAMEPKKNSLGLSSARSRNRISFMQRLSQASVSSDSNSFTILDVPDGTLTEQVAWFNQYLAEEELYGKRRDILVLDKRPEEDLSVISPDIIQGNVGGKLRLKFEKKALQKKKAILVSRDTSQYVSPLDALQDLSADFELTGTNWSAGSYSLTRASIQGRLLNNTLSIGTLRCQDEGGFFGQANGYIRADGSVKMHGDMEKAPAALLARYFQAPVVADGEYSGHLDIKGNIKEPEGDGLLVWTNGTLNGQKLQEARSELKCENGRCAVNVSARVGRKEYPRAVDDDEKTRHRRRKGEVLRVSVQVPIVSYWNKVLRECIPEYLLHTLFEDETDSFARHDVDDQVQMVVDIRKFGLVFLNAVLPDLRWTGGSADVNMKVSGSLRLPVVKGHVNVQDGRMWPGVLAQPIDGVKGTVLFDEAGTVSLKSVYGRCNGKGLHVHGDILLSELHRDTLREVASYGRLRSSAESATSVVSSSEMSKVEMKALNERKSKATALQEKVTRGLTFEMGDVPINVKDVLEGTIAGKVVLKRTLANPEVSGSMGISKGAIFLSNPSSRGDMRRRAKEEFLRAEQELKLRKSSKMKGYRTPGDDDMGKSQKQKSTGSDETTSIPEERIGRSEKMSETMADGTEIKKSTLDLNGLRISIGREMQIVYPFLLNLEAHGSLEISGPLHRPEPHGTIYFSQGQVNLLASRMDIKRGEESYARFERGSSDEPIVNIALEDDDVVVRIHEAVPSKWANHLEIKNKRGGQLGDSSWGQVLLSRLESGDGMLTAQSALRKLANSYVTQVAGTKGQIGSFQWRFHPILGGVSGESSGNVAEDLGAGARISYGRGSLSVRTALSGAKALAFEFRPWKWLGLNFESEGELKHVQVEIRLGRNRKRARKQGNAGDQVEEKVEGKVEKRSEGVNRGTQVDSSASDRNED